MRRTVLAIAFLLAGGAVPGAVAEDASKIQPTSYAFSHHEWLTPEWGDPTGASLTDGKAGAGARPVIFKGAMNVDFTLPGRFRVERVVVHAFRGNEWYLLDAVQLFAREMGSFVPVAKDSTGYRGKITSPEYVYEFKGLSAVTDCVRVQILTPNHTGLTEVEFFGRPAGGAPASAGVPPLPLSAGPELVAREGILDGSGRRKVLLDNRFVQLLVDPQRGGIVESAFHKAAGRQLTFAPAGEGSFPGGLVEDHNWDPDYSYAQFPYAADLRKSEDRATVVLRGRGRGGMYGFTEITKTLVLHRDRASLDVNWEFRNDPSSMTEFTTSPWLHHCLAVAGEANTYYMPSARGTQAFPWKPGVSGFDTWVYEVTRGWAGVLGESGAGAAVETDFRTLNCLYACFLPETTTLEWRMTRLPVAPGASLKTFARFDFVRGLKSLDGAGAGMAGSIEAAGRVAPDEEGEFRAALFSDRAREVAVTAAAERVAGGARVALGSERASLAAGETKTWSWKGRLPAGTYRLLLTAAGAGERTVLERALVVGTPDVAYAQAPEAKRFGTPGRPGKAVGVLPRHDLSFEVETPHEKWAKPLPGGPIRAFILVDVADQRDIVELAQRLDLQAETVKIRSNIEGADYAWRGDRSIASLADAQERILDLLLKRKFDVLVIGAMDWKGHFTDAIRGAIAGQVRAGAGLVWIGKGAEQVADERGAGLLPVSGTARREWTTFALPDAALANAVRPEENLARLFPLAEQLALLAYGHEKPLGPVHLVANVIGGKGGRVPILVTGAYEKGRTVALTWDDAYHGGRDYPSRLLPAFAGHPSIRPRDPSYRYWEDLYALLARVLVWAARRDAEARLVTAAVEGEPPALRVTGVGVPAGARLRVSWQDEFGAEVAVTAIPGRQAAPAADRKTWILSVPAEVPAGPAYAHLFLRDRADCALDWGAVAFTAAGPVRLVRVEQPRPCVPAGTPVEATAVIERADPAAALRLDVIASDGFGRQLAKESLPVPPGEKAVQVPLRCATVKALGGQVKLALVLRDAGRVYARRMVSFGLTRVLPLHGPRLVVWDMTMDWGRPHLETPEAHRALEMGMDAVLHYWSRVNSPAYKVMVENGVQFHPMNVLSINDDAYARKKAEYGKTGDKTHLVRSPSFADPQDREKLLKAFKAACAGQAANGGAVDYCLGDEMSLSYYADYFDYDFHPSAIAGFRAWLRKEYGSLDALNAEWETRHASWDDVQPMAYNEAKAAKNPAPWGDFRTYMEVIFADFFALLQKTLREMDPNGHISISGTQSPVAANGMDWWRLSRVIPIFHSYNTSNSLEARRSFSPWQCDEPWYAGYWAEDPGLLRNMWWCLLHNGSGVSAWYLPVCLYPDLTFTESGGQIRDHWRELKSGIWQQVRALRPDRARVAVHYSQASIHASFVRGEAKAVHDAWEGWFRSLEDLGIAYDFLSYEQLERGDLDKGQYRVLVLPHSIALSDKEVAAIARFAAAGGQVIADVPPGITDQRCRRARRDSLGRLLGARAAGAAPENALGLHLAGGGALRQLRPASALALAGGTAGGKSADGEVPVLVRHRVGKGQAVLLNWEPGFYETERKLGKEPERVWRGLLRNLLAGAGVAAPVLLHAEGGALSHVEVRRYLDAQGRTAMVGLLNSLFPGMADQRVQLRFPDVKAGVVYDVRAGRLVSRSPRLDTVLRPGEPKLYAVLPAPVKPAVLPPGHARLGAEAKVEFAFLGCSLPQAVRCEVIDAAGKARPEYGGVIVAPAGRGQVRLPLAVNDPPGAWMVRLTHILTGQRQERTLQVAR